MQNITKINSLIKILFLTFIFMFFFRPIPAHAYNIEKSVVKIFTTSNTPDYFSPWKMKDTASFTGSGVVISDNRIMTCAHVVEYPTFIQIQKYGDPKKYIARIESVSHDSDLAILKVDDKSFFDDVNDFLLNFLIYFRDEIIRIFLGNFYFIHPAHGSDDNIAGCSCSLDSYVYEWFAHHV